MDARIEALRQAMSTPRWVLFTHGTVVAFPDGPADGPRAQAVLAGALSDDETIAVGAAPAADGAWVAVGEHPDVLTWVTPSQLGGGPREPHLIGRYGDHLRRRDAAEGVIVHIENP